MTAKYATCWCTWLNGVGRIKELSLRLGEILVPVFGEREGATVVTHVPRVGARGSGRHICGLGCLDQPAIDHADNAITAISNHWIVSGEQYRSATPSHGEKCGD